MKRTKLHVFTAVALTALVLLSVAFYCGCVQPEKVSAIDSDTFSSMTEIHYYSDSAPLVSPTIFSANFTTPIQYHYLTDLTEQDLSDMLLSGDFSFGSEHTLIIFEIRHDIIDGSVLENVFSEFKAHGCYIIFNSAYFSYEYSNTNFTNYVDEILLCSFDFFYLFVKQTVFDILNVQSGIDNSCILLDGRWFSDVGDFSADMETMCDSSPFLKILMRQLCIQLGMSYDRDYDVIVQELRSRNVHLLVNIGNYMYVDLLHDTDQVSPIIVSDGIYINVHERNDLRYYFSGYTLYAMGQWSLESEFYHLLLSIQETSGDDVEVYVFEVDPIVYGHGLRIHSDTDLVTSYGGYYSPVEYEIDILLDELIAGGLR